MSEPQEPANHPWLAKREWMYFAILAAAVSYSFFPGHDTQIKIPFGDKNIELQFSNDAKHAEQNLDAIFAKLLANDMRPSAVAAARKYDLFELHDAELAAKIKDLRFDDPLAKSLREMFTTAQGPFSAPLKTVRVKILKRSETNLPKGQAKVCPDSVFRNNWLLINLPIGLLIPVKATDILACSPNSEGENEPLSITEDTLTELMPKGSVIERDLFAQAQVTFSLIPELPRASNGVSGSLEIAPASSLVAQK